MIMRKPPPPAVPADATLAVNEATLLASICRESFWQFLQEFWEVVVPEPPVWNWHIPFLCDELQYIAEMVFAGTPKEYDLIINVPPGTTKSTIVSVAFPAWCWTRMPTCRIFGASYTAQLALDLSNKCRDIVKSEKYRACFPHITIRQDVDAKGHFMNTLGGERYAFGAGGAVMGKHAHIILVDDPLDPEQAASQAELRAVNRWMTETLPSRKVSKEVTPTVLIQQRLHQDDPTGHLLTKKKNIRHICLPAQVQDGPQPPELAAYYKGGLLDPIRLSPAILEEALLDLGDYGYAGQYRQKPVPPGGGMFKIGMFNYGDPTGVKFVRVVRYWDKAGTAGGGCYTVGLKLGVEMRRTAHGMRPHYWILDVVRGQWDANEREKRIRQTAEGDGKDVTVWVEQGPAETGKESAQATIANLAGYKARADKVTGDKEERADPWSSQVNAGNVTISNRLPPHVLAAFIAEYTYFPFSTYKDQVDAGSGAFAKVTRKRTHVGAF